MFATTAKKDPSKVKFLLPIEWVLVLGYSTRVSDAPRVRSGSCVDETRNSIRRNMTKRHMLVPIASFLLNVSTLEAQEWTEMSGRVSPYVTRLDGERLTCGLATQEEMASIREALDRMPRGLHPLGKYALAPPAANISVNYRGFTPEARTAFQRAVDIWSALLITEVPIEIDASFGEIESLAHAGSFSAPGWWSRIVFSGWTCQPTYWRRSGP